jgi:hypothetical protein
VEYCTTLHKEHVLLLTPLWPQWFIDIYVWQLCWPGTMMKCISMLFKAWTLLAVCMGELSSWKIASPVRNVWTIVCTWLTEMSEDQQNTKILLPKSTQNHLCVLQFEPGIQEYRLPWVLSKQKPSLMFGTTWTTHLTMLCISSHQTSRFYDHHTIFFALKRHFQ